MKETILLVIAVSLRIVSNPLGNVYQKRLTLNGCHPLVVNFTTYLLLAFFCIFTLAFIKLPYLSASFWLYSVLGGIAGALGNGFLVKALHQGELSVLGPINAYKSVVGMITGIFLLSEIPDVWGLLGVILIVYGSYFVLDTTDERFTWALLKKDEIKFRLLAMILTAIEAVFIKKVILASDTSMAFVSWCCSGAVFSLILLMVYKVELKKEFSKSLKMSYLSKFLLLILCIGTMQYSTNYSFNHMPVGYALALFQLSVILSVLFGYRFFNEKDILKKLLGSLVMILGSVLIILVKH
ncbi:MAG: GRP family sugar transporter [Bacteroidales bacterium]